MAKQAFEQLYELLDKIVAKRTNNETCDDEVRDALFALTVVKGEIRNKYKKAVEAGKRTEQAKVNVDNTYLRLQNLMYEEQHILKEIEQCQSYRSRAEDIHLVGEEEFVSSASPDQEIKDDAHKLMLARLEWEKQEREKAAGNLKELQARKDALSRLTMLREKKLKSMPAAVESLLQASKEVAGIFSAQVEGVDLAQKDSELLNLLPQPLYVLFVTVTAFEDCKALGLQAEIVGEAERARSFGSSDREDGSRSRGEPAERVKSPADNGHGDDNDAAPVEMETADDSTPSPAVTSASLLETFPLSIRITIPCGNLWLPIEFFYVPKLEIVSVKEGLTDDQRVELGSVPVLAELYHQDQGVACPRASALFLMDDAGVSSLSAEEDRIGRPYAWAQMICGLQVSSHQLSAGKTPGNEESSSREQPSLNETLARKTTTKVVRDIQERVKARRQLVSLIKSLESGTLSPPKDARALFPLKASAKPVSCKSLPSLDNKDDIRLEVLLESRGTQLKAIVTVPASYPIVPPTFSLSFAQTSTSASNLEANLRAMEAEVNVHYNELLSVPSVSRSFLLVLQIRRLQMCLDIFIEAEHADSESDALSGKLFTESAMGPDRIRPYMWNPDSGFFEHRP